MTTSKHLKIGEILIQNHFCTSQQVHYALKVQQDYPAKNIGTILLELGYVTKENLKKAIDEQIKSSYKPQAIKNS